MFTVNNYNSKWSTSELLGASVCWSVKSGRYEYKALIESIKALGLDTGLLKEQTMKQAFMDAMNHIAKASKQIVKKIDDDKEKMIYGIVDSMVDKEEQSVKFNHHTVLTFNKKTGEIKGSENGSPWFIQDIQARAKFYKDSIPDGKIRTFCTDTLHHGGSRAIRPSGGVYFMFRDNLSWVNKLYQFLSENKLGRVYALSIPDEIMERINMAIITHDNTIKELEEEKALSSGITVKGSAIYNSQDRLAIIVDRHNDNMVWINKVAILPDENGKEISEKGTLINQLIEDIELIHIQKLQELNK